MKFTVLGGRGFIGRNLASRLRQDGHDVMAPHRDEPLVGRSLGHVLYCIGVTSDFRRRPFDTVRAHVTVLSEVLEQAEFTSLLYLSSTRVYAKSTGTAETTALPVESGDPSDLYNLSKLMGESLCLNSGREGTRIARLSNVVGFDPESANFLSELISQALDGTIVLRTASGSAKDYIALEDVIALLPRVAVEGRDRIYNVASGCNLENGSITAALQSLTGCRVRVAEDAPNQTFPPIGTDRIRREFGFQPADPLAGLRDMVPAYREWRRRGSPDEASTQT
jgi:nucleoside-diphosphate-sugar epimerase